MTFLIFSQLPESIFHLNFLRKFFLKNQVKFILIRKYFLLINFLINKKLFFKNYFLKKQNSTFIFSFESGSLRHGMKSSFLDDVSSDLCVRYFDVTHRNQEFVSTLTTEESSIQVLGKSGLVCFVFIVRLLSVIC